ncbi:MAG: hypothetical protein IJ043_10000 [Clostridia bacterium]|nr:hypothetical protein [Clostridia bacterium]
MKKFLILLCLPVLLLAGCSSAQSLAPQVICRHLIPFVGGEATLLEQDDYGRSLYQCGGDKGYSAYLIIQKVTRDYACCYEKLGYMYTTQDISMATFKDLNDWGRAVPADAPELVGFWLDTEGYESCSEKLEKALPAALEAYHPDLFNDFDTDTLFTADLYPFHIVREKTTGKSYILTLSDATNVKELRELTGEPEQWRDQISDFKATARFDGVANIHGEIYIVSHN